MGEAIAPSILFIILKGGRGDQGDEGYARVVAWGPLLEFYQLWRSYEAWASHREVVSE